MFYDHFSARSLLAKLGLITQVMADKLLCASKRLTRYIALYSMAGVAMENRLFKK